MSSILAQDLRLSVPLVAKRRPSLRTLSIITDFYSRNRKRTLRPLIRGMSFQLNKGDRVGLIGQNGAGKTTLLRLLAGVLAPSSGRLEIQGAAQTLLNVSMGMQQGATGIENIYLRGYCSGLTASEIKERIPEIIEFTGLQKVIEDPIRSYSSGMQLRLAFAVATSVKPEILLLDEWISTGDRFFIERSKERLLGHINSSELLVFASHSMGLLEEMCTRGLVLKLGQIVFDGDIKDALEFYKSDEYRET